MGSESLPRHLVSAGALLLAAAGFGAGASSHADGAAAPLALVGSGCAALLAIALIRRGVAAMRTAVQAPAIEVPVGVPRDHAQLAQRLLAVESQLEHAPIALFRVGGAECPAVEPLNVSARRLLAPGHATDLAAVQRALGRLVAGQRSIIDIGTERGAERTLATAGSLIVEGSPQRLVALMPMEAELEAEAMHAWQKLVHVLTHEIMNSLTPVASLSRTARELLAGAGGNLPADIATDLDIALDAISRRADSLTHFVGGYRALASVPAAKPQRIVVAQMFARLSALMAPSWQQRGGRAVFTVEPDSLELMADPGQLEQALVNLLANAAEATSDLAAAKVSVSARLGRGGRLRIEVCDNGPGVQDALLADIFTPFFSTKQRGSGIGLAMVRQLAHRNGGAVRYVKSVGPGARFIITF